MASPQLENGHLKIANELIEAILSADLGRREQKVIWAVIRKTYGFNKKADAISNWQIAQMTGIKRIDVGRTLRRLIARNIILRSDSGVHRHGTAIQSLAINKNYEQWGTVSNPDTVTVSEPDTVPNSDTVGNSDTVTVSEPDTQTVSKPPPTKDSKDRKTERGRARSEKTRTGGNGHGSRIPEDFTLTQERQQAAEKQGLRPSEALYEMEKFRDYWQAQPGQRGRKADWEATWRNWCRRSVEMRGDGDRPRRHETTGPQTPADFALDWKDDSPVLDDGSPNPEYHPWPPHREAWTALTGLPPIPGAKQ